MFIAILKYKKSLEEVDALLPKHRKYLQKLFSENKLLICGRLNPRTGGIIISKSIDRLEFEKLLDEDPFNTICEREIFEFIPTLHSGCLSRDLNVIK
jgi:uncharacterized protein YciI